MFVYYHVTDCIISSLYKTYVGKYIERNTRNTSRIEIIYSEIYTKNDTYINDMFMNYRIECYNTEKRSRQITDQTGSDIAWSSKVEMDWILADSVDKYRGMKISVYKNISEKIYAYTEYE